MGEAIRGYPSCCWLLWLAGRGTDDPSESNRNPPLDMSDSENRDPDSQIWHCLWSPSLPPRGSQGHYSKQPAAGMTRAVWFRVGGWKQCVSCGCGPAECQQQKPTCSWGMWASQPWRRRVWGGMGKGEKKIYWGDGEGNREYAPLLGSTVCLSHLALFFPIIYIPN